MLVKNQQYTTEVPDGLYQATVTYFKKGMSNFGVVIKWGFTILDGQYQDKVVLGSTDPKPKNPRKFVRWLKPFNLIPTDVWDREEFEHKEYSPIGQDCQILVMNGYVKEIIEDQLTDD